jgi:hypothetical protein
MSLIMSLLVGGMVTLRDARNDSTKLPTQGAPTLAELNQSITLGRRYINALYKPLPGGEAVQSEASGVPLKAYFPGGNTWVLMGEDKTSCVDDDCQTTTHISDVSDSTTHDSYTASFSTRTNRDALRVKVDINWAYSARQFQLQLTPLQVKEPVKLWLDETKITAYKPGNLATSKTVFGNTNQSLLKMLRFTVRHATQEAYLYWSTYGKDPAKALALRNFLQRNGFTPGFDLRAPLYAASGKLPNNLPDDLPVDDAAYPDCVHTPTGDQHAYAYRSKACLYESAYIGSGERDPFLQAWDALTILMKYGGPNHDQPEWGWWTQGDTPNQASTHLRGQWNRTGMGIPKCTPFSCGEHSEIRTSVFGALETQLGYKYGDQSAQRFADAAAKVIITAQIGTDGQIHADNGKTYVRPGQVGSYLSAWVAPGFQFTNPSTPALPVAVALFVKGASPTPLEYQGIVPSNSETSLDALGFLSMYRCSKYHAGCI